MLAFAGAMLLMMTAPLFAAPAFPGAEGFGAEGTGGRGGIAIPVARLDDATPSQPGPLRCALTMDSPRIVVFNTGGVIKLNRRITAAPNLPIAGQTAPGDGITIAGGISLRRNSIVRYIRVRPGAVADADSLEIYETDVIIDHCSLSWASDENIGFKRIDAEPDRNVTIQWTIMSEAEKGCLAWYAHKVTFHHNLFAHNYIRNPVYAAGSFPHLLDYRNNVVYDIGNSALALKGLVNANVVGNYFKVGKESRRHRYCVNVEGDPPTPDIKIYLKDIYGPRVAAGQPEWIEVQNLDVWGTADEAMHRVQTPFATPPVTTHDSQTAFNLVLEQAGANLPVRDRVDERIVNETRYGLNTGGYPTGPAVREIAVSEWATLTYDSGTPIVDSDGDGMPDTWEMQNGLNPYDPADASVDSNGDGYTNIETYINSKASLTEPPAQTNQPPVAVAGPDQTVNTDGDTAQVKLDGTGSFDPENQPLTYLWTWKDAGDGRQATGAAPTVTLPTGVTTITLVVNDGALNSQPGMTTVTVVAADDENQAPAAPQVKIEPAAPTTNDNLVATATATDPDGDTVTFTYVWYRNGAHQTGLDGNTVAADLTSAADTWRVVVTPHDGELAGPTGEATVMVAADDGDTGDRPVKPTVRILPDPPRAYTDLVADVSGNGADVTYRYEWYGDGRLQTRFPGNTVRGAYVDPGEHWRVVVTPVLGDVVGPSTDASVVIPTETATNTAPTAPTVTIAPAAPEAGDDLVATATGSTDAEGDTITYTYAWYRDGALEGAITGNTVAANLTSGGQTWRVVVTPSDGKLTGTSGEASVTIKEDALLPPTAATVTLTPASPLTTDDIVANADGSTCPQGGSVTYAYKWTCDGAVQSDITGRTVPASRTAKGQAWRVAVTPQSGELSGPTCEASVEVADTAPTQPTVKLTPADPTNSDDIIATISGCMDADGDNITYAYEWYRDGERQTITGAMILASQTSAGETWRVVVRPSDGELSGPACEASVTIAKDAPQPPAAPTAPTVTILPENPAPYVDLTAVASGSTSPDGGTVVYTYVWYADARLQTRFSGATVDGAYVDPGEHWRVVVTPMVGDVAGPSAEASVVIGEQAETPAEPAEPAVPTAPTVKILPENPAPYVDLTAVASGSTSPDGGTVVYTYVWYADARLQTRFTGANVDGAYVDPGEHWRVVVTPMAGDIAGPTAEASVVVADAAPALPNTPPSVSHVEVTPDQPVAGDTLTATAYGWRDEEGASPDARWEWQWKRGSQWITIPGANTHILTPDRFGRGARLRVICTPWDGADYGQPVSADVNVSNGKTKLTGGTTSGSLTKTKSG